MNRNELLPILRHAKIEKPLPDFHLLIQILVLALVTEAFKTGPVRCTVVGSWVSKFCD